MKILIVGLGSIGRRHRNCLLNIGGVEVAALRTTKGSIPSESGTLEFYTMDEAMTFNPDGVIISNPTSLHVNSALPFLKKGKKVLIEKPIADSLAKCESLRPYKSNIAVAYCMRFLPLISFIKQLVSKERVFKVSFKRSYYLPKWHPNANYRTEYAARKELGGGVIRTLSHEIDLMLYWFGTPKSVSGVTDKISDLEIDTDDFAYFTCKMENGTRVNFELDFFSPANINIGELFSTNGKYHWDMDNVFFTPYDQNSAVNIFSSGTPIETMYHDQMKDFIEFIRTSNSLNANFENALQVLSIVEAVDTYSVQ